MTEKNWLDEPQYFEEGFKKKLPVQGKKNILITSALPYVNNVPHLGNIIGSTLSADVFSRYCRIRGYESLFVCGTDEYGTATEMKALEKGVTPKEICDEYYELHKGIYEWFSVDFDYFGRTTTPLQTELTQDVFLKLHKNGFTSTSTLEQLHCGKCDKFLADRYVFGVCPHCKFDDARGDQCDGCSKLLDAVNLIDPRCHLCKSTPTLQCSKHIFLDLDRLSVEVEKHFNQVISREGNHWSANAIAIVRSWLKSGLEKRCITRDLKWGTPVPLDEFAAKVFYVWFDAPIGYMSVTKALLGDGWTKWWKNPKEVELYHFLGKDNVAFHGVIFPATQIATGDNYTRVSHMCATEYLNYEDKKFSKSRGIGVFGDNAKDTGIPADVWRFYLVYMRPESQDTAFCWDDFMLKVNSELNANLGNFVMRGLSFIYKFFDATQPQMTLTAVDEEYIKSVNAVLTVFIQDLENVKLRDALTKLLAVSRLGNQYMQANKPWELTKGSEEERKRAGTVVAMISNMVMLLSVMLYPFMPKTSQEIRRLCNVNKCILLPQHFIQFLKPGHKILEPVALFAKIEPAQVQEFKKRFCSSDDILNNNNVKEKAVNGKPANSQKSKTPKTKDSNSSAKEAAKKATAKVKEMPQKEQKNAPGPKSFKEQYPKICSDNVDISTSQAQIDALFKSVEEQFEAAKAAFVAKELPKIEAKNRELKKEVDELRTKMGYLPIPGVKVVSAASSNSADNERKTTKTENTPKIENKPAAKKEKAPKGEKGSSAPAEDGEVDVGRLDLRVGRIIEAKKHPDADALYVETIDLGEEKPRTVVSGLVRFVPLEQMQNRLVICVCNLKPAKMRGVESQAMVLCASTPDKVEIMEVDASCKPGDRLTCEPFPSRPDAVLNPKKKVWETVAVDLKVSDAGTAIYKGEVLKVNGVHPIRAPSLRNVPVK